MAVYEAEQTNPRHYALQVMHATGLVCSNAALEKAAEQFLLYCTATGDNEQSLFYVNRNH